MRPNTTQGVTPIKQVPKLTFEFKTRQEIEYRESLLDDLLNQRTHYSSGPYEAHIQFSNFCNMSCIMCWDGRNPPAKKASPELLEKINQQVAPHLSVMTPYSGSEPLVWAWNETREMAERNSILLCITTNVQYLNEKRFDELKNITETLLLSIDSHIPEIFEIIRPGGDVGKVFANLKTTAELSRKHGIECIVNIVLMTLNAPHLAETIDYLGNLGIESVNVIQMLDVNGRSRYFDPLLHFSQDYVDWIKRGCLKMVKQKQMRLIWSVAGCVEHDYRPSDHVKPLERKSWNDDLDDRMRRMFPGFCRNVLNRLRIDGEGDVAPCCYATQGELSLGNLNEKNFDEIWNGPSAQDLRRGMLCGDVPAHCSSCRYIDAISPQTDLEFIGFIDEDLIEMRRARAGTVEATLTWLDATQASRHVDAPEILIAGPLHGIEEFHVVLSLAGETEEFHRLKLHSANSEDKEVRIQLPDDAWGQLRSNVGYWWNIWAIPKDTEAPIMRSKLSYCLIRHEHIDRIPESKLRYTDKGALPIIDLGVSKQLGWETPDAIPGRPETFAKRRKEKKNATDDLDAQKSIATSAKPTPKNSGSVWQKLTSHFATKQKGTSPSSVPTMVANFREGYIDEIIEQPEFLHVVGWMLSKTGPFETIEFESTSQHSVTAARVQRPDVESGYPKIELAIDSGFEIKLKAEHFKTEFGYEFMILGKNNGKTVSQLRVIRFDNEKESREEGPFWFGRSERLTIN